jgi:hypothetical protein
MKISKTLTLFPFFLWEFITALAGLLPPLAGI